MDEFYASRGHIDVYKIQQWGRIDIEGGSDSICRKILIIFGFNSKVLSSVKLKLAVLSLSTTVPMPAS